MRLIDADALMIAVEKDFEGVCVYDVPPSEAVSDFERIVDSMPTIEHFGNIDISANAVFDIATKEDHLRFRETDEMCPVCQRDLEVYYCENRTYIVRCKHCHIVTLVSAASPDKAAAKVGLHVKPVRHGRWKEPYPNDIWDCYECSCCGEKYGNAWKHCPNCGAKMDLEVQDE